MHRAAPFRYRLRQSGAENKQSGDGGGKDLESHQDSLWSGWKPQEQPQEEEQASAGRTATKEPRSSNGGKSPAASKRQRGFSFQALSASTAQAPQQPPALIDALPEAAAIAKLAEASPAPRHRPFQRRTPNRGSASTPSSRRASGAAELIPQQAEEQIIPSSSSSTTPLKEGAGSHLPAVKEASSLEGQDRTTAAPKRTRQNRAGGRGKRGANATKQQPSVKAETSGSGMPRLEEFPSQMQFLEAFCYASLQTASSETQPAVDTLVQRFLSQVSQQSAAVAAKKETVKALIAERDKWAEALSQLAMPKEEEEEEEEKKNGNAEAEEAEEDGKMDAEEEQVIQSLQGMFSFDPNNGAITGAASVISGIEDELAHALLPRFHASSGYFRELQQNVHSLQFAGLNIDQDPVTLLQRFVAAPDHSEASMIMANARHLLDDSVLN